MSPAKVTDVSFDDIVSKAKAHFNPKPSPIVKRYEFNTRRQGEDETISTYVSELRKIAEHCEYGAVLSDMLRDRLVCGILDKTVQRRLLQQVDLTFDRAFEIALAAEAADKDSRRLMPTTTDKDLPSLIGKNKDLPVHNLPAGGRGTRPRLSKPQHKGGEKQQGTGSLEKECSRCGGKHSPAHCPFKNAECHFCKRKGHIARKCRQKGHQKGHQKAHHVGEKEVPGGDSGEYLIFHVKSGQTAPLYATVNVNGHPISMEIDTGASVSITSREVFEQIREGESHLELEKPAVHLQTYTGESIKVCGSAAVNVTHNGQTRSLPLVVTDGSGPTLLGRNWLEALQLDWRSIFHVGRNLSLQQVLAQHADVFKEGLGELRGTTAKIHIDSSTHPRFEKPRQVPFAIRAEVEKELERLLALGILQPVQFSDWATPIVPVRKSDGGVRICGDYKITVNRAAKLDKYPIPRIEELFASLSGGKTFSKLDLSHAYLQIPLDEQSQPYVTINTHKGLFRYTRLPFGIASAPSIFQRVMENLLQGIPRVCVYLDDILVIGANEQEHLANLAQVLQRLQSAGMRLKSSKCAFLLSSVSYLGHTISAEGLQSTDAKVQAIVDAPDPKNVAELRSFLGMVNYYGKFLPNLATVLAPLYKLLRQTTAWKWGYKQKNAFGRVKKLLLSSRVLTHFDDQLPLILECDASPYGLGAVLSHQLPDGTEKPVGFASRTLSKAEQNYSHLDKEALAIIFGVKKYHQYIYGRQFVIKTDHKPLTHIFSESKAVPTMASGRIQRWAITLGAYDYVIRYKQGSTNANADALSRLPLPTAERETPQPAEVVHLMEHLSTTPLSSQHIKTLTDVDPSLSRIRCLVQEGWPDHVAAPEGDQEFSSYAKRRLELSVEGGCVLWGCRVVVPGKARKRAMEMLHGSHPGMAKMKSLARSYLWWPGMDKAIEECVKKCDVCQQTRKDPPTTPLHPWVWPDKPWTRVHIDYAGPLEGKMFLLIADAHSKWIEIHATSSSTSSTTIELLRKTFASLGLPEVLVSDNATAFTSAEFSEFLQRNGIRHVRTPPYHPASNGLVERAVQSFKEGMKRIRDGSINTRLARYLFKYRSMPHSSTGMSPAEMLYGRKLRTQLDLLVPSVGKNVRNAQDRQRRNHDTHCRPRSFNQGDSVYVKNYGPGPKWLPGNIVETEGSVMYQIQLSDGRMVRRHADQLRSRVAGSEHYSPSDDGGGSGVPIEQDVEIGETQETETQPVEPEDHGTQSTEPESPPTANTASGETPVQEELGNPERHETVETGGTQPEQGTPMLRRSTRNKQPPVRFEEQSF